MANIETNIILGMSIEQLSQFLHYSIDKLVGKTGPSLNNINNDLDWSQNDYKIVGIFIENEYREMIANADYKIEDVLKELGPERIQCIIDCFKIRKAELQRALTKETLISQNDPVVTDYDWKLKWVIGSSTLSSIREPLFQLDLHTQKMNLDSKCTADTFKLEMNVTELTNFINEAEKALTELKK